MNKYLEKIAASLKTINASRNGVDIYQLKDAVNKRKRKKSTKPTITNSPSRKFNKK